MNMKLEKMTYVDQAENVIDQLIKKNNGETKLNTYQIRNILDLFNNILSSMTISDTRELDAKLFEKLQYIRMKLLYMAGKDAEPRDGGAVNDFLKKSQLIDYIKGVKSIDDIKLLCKYMESLVAYHKYKNTIEFKQNDMRNNSAWKR